MAWAAPVSYAVLVALLSVFPLFLFHHHTGSISIMTFIYTVAASSL